MAAAFTALKGNECYYQVVHSINSEAFAKVTIMCEE